MDARTDPLRLCGLDAGDTHIIRNAGGRASDDAIRSLIVSHTVFSTDTWLVIQHTNCAMSAYTNQELATRVNELPCIEADNQADATRTDWLVIRELEESVRGDVRRIANHPFVPNSISIYGCIFDVSNGELFEVEGASRVA